MIANKYIGKKFITKYNEEVEIIKYIDSKNVIVKFTENNYIIDKKTSLSQIKSGVVKNPYRKTVLNIGYIGIVTNEDKLKYYSSWHHMLSRCYTKHYGKTYEDCFVHESWHSFENFVNWCKINYIDGYELDKDLLVNGNKMYGPETCCFIPKAINNLFYQSNGNHEKYGIRVINENGSVRYRPRMKYFNSEIYLGSFETLQEAIDVYKKSKENYIKQVADKWKDKISEKVYNRLKNYEFTYIEN